MPRRVQWREALSEEDQQRHLYNLYEKAVVGIAIEWNISLVEADYLIRRVRHEIANGIGESKPTPGKRKGKRGRV